MHLSLRPLLLGSLFALTALSRTAPANACSAGCAPIAVFPFGTVPANTTALEIWQVPSATPIPGNVHLERMNGSVWESVPAAVPVGPEPYAMTVTPSAPFVVGGNYRLGSGDLCSSARSEASFIITASAPLPTTLGTLRAAAPHLETIQGGLFVGGICHYPVQAVVSEVTLDASPEVAPWQGLLFYEARVDGNVYEGTSETIGPSPPPPGATYHGRGSVRLSVPCAAGRDPLDGAYPFDSTGLAEGDHEVVFRARVVGTDVWAQTPPITVALHCAVADGGTPPGSSAASCTCRGAPTRNAASAGTWLGLALGVVVAMRTKRRGRRIAGTCGRS